MASSSRTRRSAPPGGFLLLSVTDGRLLLLTAAGLTAAGCPGALFPAEFFQAERGELTLFIPVNEGAKPSGYTRIPAAEVAVMTHQGSPDDIDRTYGALGTAVAERAIGVDGPIREYYLVSQFDTDDQAAHRTEVCWPVFRTGAE